MKMVLKLVGMPVRVLKWYQKRAKQLGVTVSSYMRSALMVELERVESVEKDLMKSDAVEEKKTRKPAGLRRR